MRLFFILKGFQISPKFAAVARLSILKITGTPYFFTLGFYFLQKD